MMMTQRRKGAKGFFNPPAFSQIYILKLFLKKIVQDHGTVGKSSGIRIFQMQLCLKLRKIFTIVVKKEQLMLSMVKKRVKQLQKKLHFNLWISVGS